MSYRNKFNEIKFVIVAASFQHKKIKFMSFYNKMTHYGNIYYR